MELQYTVSYTCPYINSVQDHLREVLKDDAKLEELLASLEKVRQENIKLRKGWHKSGQEAVRLAAINKGLEAYIKELENLVKQK